MTDTHSRGMVDPSEHIYRLKMDAIKWQMRLDLRKMLEEFAASVR